jgi:hypothetical protein
VVSEDPQLDYPNGWAAYENAQQFLEMDGWFPQAIEGTTGFVSRFVGRNGELRVVTNVNVEREILRIYAICGISVPEPRRLAMAEFITRANYGLQTGNFELDLSDGEVRFKSSLVFREINLTAQMLNNAIYPAVATMDHYLPGVMQVAFSDVEPKAAIDAIERQ